MKKFLGVLLVGLLILGSLAGCATAEFEVGPLSIAPSEVWVGTTFTVKSDISNVGGADGSYSATLIVDGNVTETKDVTVSAGSKEEVSFTCSLDTAGVHTLELGGRTTSVTALCVQYIYHKYSGS